MASGQLIHLQGHTVGRYKLTQLLGHGSVADVWLAEDSQLRRQVAVKLLPAVRASDRGYLQDFAHEVGAAAALSHPHILPIHDYGEQPISHERVVTYLVMPYISGGSLGERLSHKNELLTIEERLRYLHQAALAIDYAHSKHVLHRDIKPVNILLQHGWLFLSDFGLAKLLDSTTRPGHLRGGTSEYMASEQAQGQAIPASDRYALAVVAYQLCTGRVPFKGVTPYETLLKQMREIPPPPRQFNPRIPQVVEDVLLKGLAKHPEDRFTSCVAFVEALERGWEQDIIVQDVNAHTLENKPVREGFRPPHLVPYALRSSQVPSPYASALLPSVSAIPNKARKPVVPRRTRPLQLKSEPLHDLAVPVGEHMADPLAAQEIMDNPLWHVTTLPPPTTSEPISPTWEVSVERAGTSNAQPQLSPTPRVDFAGGARARPEQAQTADAAVLTMSPAPPAGSSHRRMTTSSRLRAQALIEIPRDPKSIFATEVDISSIETDTGSTRTSVQDSKIGRRELITAVAPVALAGALLLTGRLFGFNAAGNTALLPKADAGPRSLISGVPVLKLTGHTAAVGVSAWDPTGRYLATGSKDMQVKLWDIATLLKSHARGTQTLTNARGTWTFANAIENNMLAWSGDGRYLAITPGEAHTLYLLDMQDRAAKMQKYADVTKDKLDATIYKYSAWQPGQNVLAISEQPDPQQAMPAIGVWQVGQMQKPTQEWVYNTPKGVHLNEIAWSLDGTLLAAASNNFRVVVWDSVKGAVMHEFVLPARALEQIVNELRHTLTWSPVVSSLLIVSDIDIATIWDVSLDRLVLALGTDDPDALTASKNAPNWLPNIVGLSWSPNGRYIAGSYEGSRRVYIWDIQDKAAKTTKDGIQIQHVLFPLHKDFAKGHADAVTSVTWSPDGRYLASSSLDGTVIIWRVDAV